MIAPVSSIVQTGLNRSRWPVWIGRVIDIVCLFALLAVAGTVVYGFWLRAIWAQGYFIAVAFAFLGALVILVGLAQQAIAARDVATWRTMAEWQIRAARGRVSAALERDGVADSDPHDELEADAGAYYDVLIGALVRDAEDWTRAVTRER